MINKKSEVILLHAGGHALAAIVTWELTLLGDMLHFSSLSTACERRAWGNELKSEMDLPWLLPILKEWHLKQISLLNCIQGFKRPPCRVPAKLRIVSFIMAVDADTVFYLDNQFILSSLIFRKSLAAILASPTSKKIELLAVTVHSYL